MACACWDTVFLIFAAIGALQVFVTLKGFFSYLYASYVLKGPNLKKYGQWAVITGASDGIGKAFATQLARKGLNIMLLSRTESKLADLQKTITESYPNVQVRFLAVDFNQPDWQAIRNALKGLDIGILVNNVGVSYDLPSYFLELKDEHIEQLINLNIKAVTEMTRIVLPGMKERRRGVIYNMSSISGAYPVPLLAVYSGTKAYVDFFSQALSEEYRMDGIVVQSAIPSIISSAMSKARASSTVPSADKWVRDAIRQIGFGLNSNPFWMHALQLWGLRLAPKSLALQYLFKTEMDIRKRAIRKREREQAAKAKSS